MQLLDRTTGCGVDAGSIIELDVWCFTVGTKYVKIKAKYQPCQLTLRRMNWHLTLKTWHCDGSKEGGGFGTSSAAVDKLTWMNGSVLSSALCRLANSPTPPTPHTPPHSHGSTGQQL